MIIYIDQSGKVEYTSKHTVVAYSNGNKAALTIKPKDKREIQKIFRKAGKGNVLEHFRRHQRKVLPTSITFHQIGRKCEAHWHG